MQTEMRQGSEKATHVPTKETHSRWIPRDTFIGLYLKGAGSLFSVKSQFIRGEYASWLPVGRVNGVDLIATETTTVVLS